MTIGEHARPFLTFHVGQAGVQIGHAIWELLCMEHNVQPGGTAKPDCPSNGFYDAMFLKSSSGHFMPRSLLVDTDPTCIDEIRVGPYRELFAPNQLLSDHNDAGFNYMRGRHDYNGRLMPDTIERFRWLLEKTDVTPAVFLIHGISGGTGSGLAVSCLEALNNDFGSSLQLIELSVSSGRSGLQSSPELVNQVLYQYESKDFTTVSFSVTNSAMYNVCRTGLNLANATYAHVNRMLAMCFSNLTVFERFPGSAPCSIASICSNVLPFKQLKHPVLACGPFTATDMVGKERLNTIGVTSAVMDPDSQLADIDLRQGRHLAGVLLYRGATQMSDVEQALATLRGKGKLDFVEWAPTSFKTGLTELPPLAVPSSGIGGTSLSVTLVSNHTAISSLFRGQSASIKKLSAGGYFLHNYESPATGGAMSGHNSGITSLLKEACEHMDAVASVYENEAPPDQSQAPTSRESRPRQSIPRDTRASNKPTDSAAPGLLQERRNSGQMQADAVRPQDGETAPATEVAEPNSRLSGSRASQGSTKPKSGEFDERFSSLSKVTGAPVVSSPSSIMAVYPDPKSAADHTTDSTYTTEEGKQRQLSNVPTFLTTSETARSQGTNELASATLVKYSYDETVGTEKSQLVQASQPYQPDQEGSMPPTSTEDNSRITLGQQGAYSQTAVYSQAHVLSQEQVNPLESVHPQGSQEVTISQEHTPSLEHTPSQSTPVTTSGGTRTVVREKATTGKPKGGKKCSKCCEKDGNRDGTAGGGGCCKKNGAEKGGGSGKKNGAEKDSGCCKKNGAEKGGGCGKKNGAEKGGGCCGKKSADKTGNQPGQRAQSECCKKRANPRVRVATANSRSQSQNHANSVLRYLSGGTSTDTESCRSASCVIPEYYRHNTDTAINVPLGTLRQNLYDNSSASTHSADSAAELSEIIQNCLPGPMSINRTISSVKQIIQKYDRMFAQDTNEAAPATAWSRK